MVRGKLDLSILVVNWNTRNFLERCLESIFDTTNNLEFEVIVVDNGSVDGSVELVRQAFPNVTLIENDVNVGFAKANNQAIAIARGCYLLLLNSDAFLHEGALEVLVRHMDEYPDSGSAGPRLIYEDGRLQRSCFSFPTLLTELWQALWLDRLLPRSPVFGKYRMTFWDMGDMREVDSVMGACMIVRSETVREVGVLDEAFFFSSEEVDFCYRLKKAGWKVRFVPNATVTHIWGGSSQVVAETTFLRLYQYRLVFFKKHYGGLTTLVYKGVLALSSVFRVLFGSFAYFLFRDKDVIRNVRNYWMLLRSLRVY